MAATGALLVVGHASEFGPMPAMRTEQVGYGAGDRDLAETRLEPIARRQVGNPRGPYSLHVNEDVRR